MQEKQSNCDLSGIKSVGGQQQQQQYNNFDVKSMGE